MPTSGVGRPLGGQLFLLHTAPRTNTDSSTTSGGDTTRRRCIQWARGDSNPYDLSLRILSPLRLPFRHLPSGLGGTRTLTRKNRILSPARLPVPPRAHCFYLEPPVRIELTAYRLQGGCSTTELQGRPYRLHDPDVMLMPAIATWHGFSRAKAPVRENGSLIASPL
jgi:hypothetical protein